MKKSILSLFIALTGFGVVTTSCEDMLTPSMDRYATEFTGKDTMSFYLGILTCLQDVVEQNALLGEIRGDLSVTTEYTSDSISTIANFNGGDDGDSKLLNRAAYYKVINQCNFYLAKVDTMAKKNNIYVMRREASQVELIRAWTYMQLVQNYKRVPFITRPVDNSATGWEVNPPEGWVDADNLIEKLGDGLERAHTYAKAYGYINYGDFNTGKVTVPHSQMIFDADIVMGDLYLLRGRDKSDYEKAAQYYYNYVTEVAASSSYVSPNASISTSTRGGRTYYFPELTTWWSSTFDGSSSECYSSRDEIITAIPSAANSSFGKMLTRIPNIYGFDIHSTNSTVTEEQEGDDGETEEVSTTSGEVIITANYKVRQIAPSPSYVRLSEAQQYVVYETDENGDITDVIYPENVTEGRLSCTAPLVRTDKGNMRFISKFGGSSMAGGMFASSGISTSAFTFRYTIPLYRLRQVYLRYAEAINRAGFPRFAFAVLRDGLEMETVPTVKVVQKIDVENKTIQDVYVVDSISEGANYISADELRRAADKPWLNFSLSADHPNGGIREVACGMSSEKDTLYTYERVVGQRIIDESLRKGTSPALAHKLSLLADDEEPSEGEGNEDIDTSDFEVLPTPEPEEASEEEIQAMETLLADEMALECAYEGWRYFDLMRIARHRNNMDGANAGTEWMAWLISRRAFDLKPYEEPQQVDSRLYNLLLNPDNWYLNNPVY